MSEVNPVGVAMAAGKCPSIPIYIRRLARLMSEEQRITIAEGMKAFTLDSGSL